MFVSGQGERGQGRLFALGVDGVWGIAAVDVCFWPLSLRR